MTIEIRNKETGQIRSWSGSDQIINAMIYMWGRDFNNFNIYKDNRLFYPKNGYDINIIGKELRRF